MRKIISALALTAAAALAGCASFNINTATSRNTLYGITNAYGVLLSGANAYKSLPLCKTGTQPSLTNICAKRSLIVQIQAADKKAIAAINDADNFIKAYPTVDATNVIQAAQTALINYQAVMADTKVQ
jgi:hypothetical protein